MTSRDPHAAPQHPEATAAVRPEVPSREDIPPPPPDTPFTRRTAMKLFSASAMVGAFAGCTRKPERYIYSAVDRPEYQRPGQMLPYASTWLQGDRPYGVVVQCISGRPIKVDGLDGHPLNGTRSNAQMQAALVSLYDAQRLRAPERDGTTISWEQADQDVVRALENASSTVIVTRALLGPSERDLVERFVSAAPGARHLVHEPAADRVRRETWRQVYGADGEVVPQLENARVILSVDCDFLASDGETIGATHGFARTRRPEAGTLSRLYVAEGPMSLTGSNADHRIPLRPSQALAFVRALGGAEDARAAAKRHGWDARVMAALVEDLEGSRGEAVVLAGRHLPAAVHAAVAELNQHLGAGGKTLAWNPQPATLPADDPAAIAEALAAGPDVAIFLGVNPAYDLPGGGFREAASKIKTTVAHGLTRNETLSASTLALPSAHNMESWNDATPLPGMTSFCQPLIAPLFDGRQEADSLLAWTKALAQGDATVRGAKDFHDFVRNRSGLERKAWQDVLRKGWMGEGRTAALPPVRGAEARRIVEAAASTSGEGFDVVLAPHPILGDGRFAGNAWLLEVPEPTTQMVWDNAAYVAPATARKLGVREGDWLRIEAGGRTLEVPAAPQPGMQPDTVLVHLGWGRTLGAGVGCGAGFNAWPLAGDGFLLAGAAVKAAGGDPYDLVRTQRNHDQMDREIARSATSKEYDEHPEFARHRRHIVNDNKQIDPEWDYSKGHKWGMAIDLNQCTGCNACMVACQSENNIPIVGKEEVSLGRDMSWIRIDRYESGPEDNPEISLLPMLCQHCDNAPCETVCPVNATAHSPDGLNMQVYNRCVGTRYCSNNCPYKVRRFNFFNYPKEMFDAPSEELISNPHVTVRMRGVMEKCTFCVQRINGATQAAANEGRDLEDGAVVTACQQACPADAIVFGDANLEGGAVARARDAALGYHVLEELNVRPNVTYKARVRNPHPSLDAGAPKGGH